MLQMMMGGRVYETSAFKKAMDSHYYPLENMKQSVEILTNSQDIDIATMEFGQYQPILAPDAGQAERPKTWLKNMGFARIHLTDMPNTTPLSRDEPDVVPLTQCALLDASIRKCFNSNAADLHEGQYHPATGRNSADPELHDILLDWEYAHGSNVPTLLNLTMVCPFVAPKVRLPEEARQPAEA